MSRQLVEILFAFALLGVPLAVLGGIAYGVILAISRKAFASDAELSPPVARRRASSEI